MSDSGDSACSPDLLGPIQQLATAFPGVSFLALGQTVFWDEPLKAVVRQALDAVSPEAMLTLAVHDTDYFARPHATLASSQPYVILPHNDGSTQNLWCAAGELAQLFGAETVPTRAALRAAGVRHDLAFQAQDRDHHEFLDEWTEAWGWRGIAQTSGIETLTHEVKTADVLETLLKLIDWGFGESARTLCQCTGTARADALAAQVRSAIRSAVAEAPDGSLSDLYQALFPQMHALVSGKKPEHVRVSHSVRESQFDPTTARLPRFRILDLFLARDTRDICAQAYNNAVHGSEIYTLDRFGEGSIPFDLVTPAGGRGTLRILDEGIHVDGRRSDFIPTAARVESAVALAEAVTAHYGHSVNLVGKAVTWIAILAAEYIFIFNEGASAYTRRTRHMLQEMRDHGVSLDVHPILRVRYDAWDALEDVHSGFCLPDHYAEAFGQREISTLQFVARWREVMDNQERLLQELSGLARPVDLIRFLQTRSPESWSDRLQRYAEAQAKVRAANASRPTDEQAIRALREERYRLGLEVDRLQKTLGEIRRQRMAQDSDDLEPRRDSVIVEITRLRERRQEILQQRTALRAEMAARRSTESYSTAVSILHEITCQAELERLRLARVAYLVSHSLEYTNRRPTGWWLPMVSPDGAWFRAICRTASAYVEEL